MSRASESNGRKLLYAVAAIVIGALVMHGLAMVRWTGAIDAKIETLEREQAAIRVLPERMAGLEGRFDHVLNALNGLQAIVAANGRRRAAERGP